MDKIQLNASLAFAEPTLVEGGTPSPSKFRLVANAGSRMNFGDGDVVIDLDGVHTKLDSGTFPVFMGHDWQKGVGHASNLRVEDGALVADGVVSRETPFAEDFAKSAKKGFPWQASVGGYIEDSIELKEDEEIEVNGRMEKAPCRVATKFVLYEVSVVEYGADDQTSASITANDPSIQGKETQKMDEKVLTATAENVVETQDAVEASVQKIREAELAEAKRVADIKARATDSDDALVQQAIEGGWTPDRFELESLRAARGNAPAIHARSNESVDAKALEIYALRASGVPMNEKRYTDQQLTAADAFKSLSLQEFCEIAAGRQLPRYKNDEVAWLNAAFSTNSLSYVLSRSFNAILLDSFNYFESEWRKVFRIGRVNDFKTADRYRLNSSFVFEKVANGGTLPHGTASDERFQIKADTYGKMYSLTRQDFINDDLGAFAQIPTQIGVGCAETINQVCWSTFMAPGNLSDSKDFYHADHGNLLASKALSLDNLSAARANFVKQKRGKNSTDSVIGIRPSLLIVPVELEDKALMLTKATTLNNGTTSDTPADYNPQRGRFQVVASAYLSDSNFTNYSATTWYLASDPRQLAGFEISFLNGKDAPTIERADADFDTLGVQFRGFIDFGVSVQDYRGVTRITA